MIRGVCQAFWPIAVNKVRTAAEHIGHSRCAQAPFGVHDNSISYLAASASSGGLHIRLHNMPEQLRDCVAFRQCRDSLV